MKPEKTFIKLPLFEKSKEAGTIYVNPEHVQYVRGSGNYNMEENDYECCIIGINGNEFELEFSPKDTVAAIFGLYDSMLKTPESKDIQGII